MAEVVVCGRCGARCWATASACFNCGLALISPAPPAPSAPPAPAAQPPAGWYGASPAGYAAHRPVATGVSKPIGVILLAIVEAGIAAVGFRVAVEMFYWTLVDFSYDSYGYSLVDLVDGLAFFIASAAGIALIVGIWQRRPMAWLLAHVLSGVLIGLIVANVIVWGINLLDIIGIVANLSVLASLNTNPIRRNFGRRPLF